MTKDSTFLQDMWPITKVCNMFLIKYSSLCVLSLVNGIIAWTSCSRLLQVLCKRTHNEERDLFIQLRTVLCVFCIARNNIRGKQMTHVSSQLQSNHIGTRDIVLSCLFELLVMDL